MSSSAAEGQTPAAPRVHLKVTAGSPLAEVFLINDDLALVQRSVGDLDAEVAPGVYKVKAKLGDATNERLILLDSAESLDVSGDLLVRSPVPFSLAPFDSTPDLDLTPGSSPSRQMAQQLGDGAEVFLMTRRAISSNDDSTSPPRVSLHRLDGSSIIALAPGPGGAPDDEVATVKVDPGPYLVRRRDSFGHAAELCIYAVAGWQTQVFTLEGPGDEAEIGRTRMSVLMARQGFDPNDPRPPVVEQARTALADERKIATDVLGELWETSDDPMLALFGAHLMLISRDSNLREAAERSTGRLDEKAVTAPVLFDQARFDRIVDRLFRDLGDGHADVTALATQRSHQSLGALRPITAPPMLWRSWILLIAASNVAPNLVPVDAWQRSFQVLPLRPFFLWAPTEGSNEIERSFTDGIAASLSEKFRKPRGVSWWRWLIFTLRSRRQRVAGNDLLRRVSADLLVPRAAIDKIAAGDPL